jgi:hypothetical protein
VHGKALPADRRRSREQHGIPDSPLLLEHLEDGFVVELRVVVVHALGARAVEVVDLERDAFAEIGLEGIHTLALQHPQLLLEPLGRARVGEVDEAHSRLPQVPLPDGSVGTLHEEAGGLGLGEEGRPLADVRIDPHADVQVLVVQARQHPLGVGEHARVPFEVAPVELAHPEAVEVEHAQRKVARGHLVDERRHRLLVVRGGERGGEPESE